MNIYEFARRCGVSIGTVSRAINDRKNVDPRTRAMILRRMRELGYQPSRTARALSTGRSQVVSVWIGDLSSRYGAKVLQHIEQHLGESDYEMLVRDLRFRHVEDDEQIAQQADGVIVVDAVGWVRRLRERPVGERVPTVNLGIYVDEETDHVSSDAEAGVRAGVEHLVESGCRRVAFLSPGPYNRPDEPRYRAYQSTMAEAGMRPEVIASEMDMRRCAMAAMEAHVRAHGCPDGLMCFNDDHAIAAYRVLRALGVRVPEDTAIVGFDGIEETEYLERPLSTVVVPLEEMCRAAWQFLERRLAEPEQPVQRLVLTPRLEVRATSRVGAKPKRGSGRRRN